MSATRVCPAKVVAIVAILFAMLWNQPQPACGDDLFQVARAVFQSLTSGNDTESREFSATHKQIGLIKVLDEKDAQGRQLQSFCLNADGNLLAAISSNPGEIHVIDPGGKLLDSWKIPITPEAINLDIDGSVLVAGERVILRLSRDGQVELKQDAPHSAAIKKNADAVRAEVVDQIKRTSRSLRRQMDVFTQEIRRRKGITAEQEQELSLLEAAIAQTASRREGTLTDAEREAVRTRRQLVKLIKESVEANLTNQDREIIKVYEKQLENYEQHLQQATQEPTEEQIEQQLQQMLAYKSRVSSISAAGDNIFLATGAAKGYGFDVWRMTRSFEDGEKIVSGLRGCCGQMDVQGTEHGLFVAENSRHRVRHYDLQGELVNEWGKRAKRGVRGFGSCCNPMNVAFGPDGSVYTAESGTGRVKRYSAEGELLGLVGAVELVPGCKKVSIAVNQDGDRVYMLDITRNHVVVMGSQRDDSQSLVQE